MTRPALKDEYKKDSTRVDSRRCSRTTAPLLNAVVHGTVLATLVENKVVPDPFYGLQNETIIDIADSGGEYYTFWFFTTFQNLSAMQDLRWNKRHYIRTWHWKVNSC